MTYLLISSLSLFLYGIYLNERGVRRNPVVNLDGCLALIAGVVGTVVWWAWRVSR